MSRAIRLEDATEKEREEMHRKVRDLINYLANYDDPKFGQLSEIRSPKAVMILIQSEVKYERGSGISTAMTAVGMFDPTAIAIMVRDWLVESEKRADLGKEII